MAEIKTYPVHKLLRQLKKVANLRNP
jgi:hypothetical protein